MSWPDFQGLLAPQVLGAEAREMIVYEKTLIVLKDLSRIFQTLKPDCQVSNPAQ